MAFVVKDRVREANTITGTGNVTLTGTPASAAYRAFSGVMTNGDTTWYCIVHPGSAWEVGIGTWVTGNILQRTTVLDSSNAGAAVSFAAGSKDIFMALPASIGNILNNTFPTGTLMLFQQTSAPIYWTKQVTHNDKALRVVSGTASFGGSNAFSAIMNTTISVANTTITNATSASHTHTLSSLLGGTALTTAGGPEGYGGGSGAHTGIAATLSMASVGSDGPHAHTLSMAIAYVDLIIASKN